MGGVQRRSAIGSPAKFTTLGLLKCLLQGLNQPPNFDAQIRLKASHPSDCCCRLTTAGWFAATAAAPTHGPPTLHPSSKTQQPPAIALGTLALLH